MFWVTIKGIFVLWRAMVTAAPAGALIWVLGNHDHRHDLSGDAEPQMDRRRALMPLTLAFIVTLLTASIVRLLM